VRGGFFVCLMRNPKRLRAVPRATVHRAQPADPDIAPAELGLPHRQSDPDEIRVAVVAARARRYPTSANNPPAFPKVRCAGDGERFLRALEEMDYIYGGMRRSGADPQGIVNGQIQSRCSVPISDKRRTNSEMSSRGTWVARLERCRSPPQARALNPSRNRGCDKARRTRCNSPRARLSRSVPQVQQVRHVHPPLPLSP